MAGKNAAKNAVFIDGVEVTNMSREELEVFTLNMKVMLDHEREQRNFFQLERDKLRTFYEITRNQLEETRADCRNKIGEREVAEKNLQSVMDLHGQNVKRLEFEHITVKKEFEAMEELVIKQAERTFKETEDLLNTEMRKMREKLRSDLDESTTVLAVAQKASDKKLAKLVKRFGVEMTKMEGRYINRMESMRDRMGLRFRVEKSELEERKNNQINGLLEHHEKAVNELKTYYNEITLSNLALITDLQEKMRKIQERDVNTQKLIEEVNDDTQYLQEPLKRAREEVRLLRRQYRNYEKDIATLRHARYLLTKERRGLASGKKNFDKLQRDLEKVREGLRSDLMKLREEKRRTLKCASTSDQMRVEALKALTTLEVSETPSEVSIVTPAPHPSDLRRRSSRAMSILLKRLWDEEDDKEEEEAHHTSASSEDEQDAPKQILQELLAAVIATAPVEESAVRTAREIIDEILERVTAEPESVIAAREALDQALSFLEPSQDAKATAVQAAQEVIDTAMGFIEEKPEEHEKPEKKKKKKKKKQRKETKPRVPEPESKDEESENAVEEFLMQTIEYATAPTELARLGHAIAKLINRTGYPDCSRTERVAASLLKKQQLAEKLRKELRRVARAHDDLLDTYELRLTEYGISKEELGFELSRVAWHGELGDGKPVGWTSRLIARDSDSD